MPNETGTLYYICIHYNLTIAVLQLAINKFMKLIELFETMAIVVNEGGWDSTITQGTKITPTVVSNAINVMKKFTIDFNNWLTKNKQHTIRMGSPLGSTAWHKLDTSEKEYGDIDLQMIATNPTQGDISISQLSTYMNKLVAEFVTQTKPGYIHDNGKVSGGHIIIRLGSNGYVQIDLIWTEDRLANWQQYRMTPARNIKGAAYGTLFATLGEIMNLSIQAAGVQMKIKDGLPVDFVKSRKVDKVDTLTTDIQNFAIDILKVLHSRIQPNSDIKIDPELIAHPGINPDNITVENLTAAIRGLAKSFEDNNMYGQYNLKDITSYNDFIRKFKEHYLNKMTHAAESSKFNKAESPEAVAKAAETKSKLISHANKVINLL